MVEASESPVSKVLRVASLTAVASSRDLTRHLRVTGRKALRRAPFVRADRAQVFFRVAVRSIVD